jgi:hypothetical protein
MNEALGTNSDPLRQTFAPLIGLPAWFVRKGYGSSLTMEFGNPHLEIRQPKAASPQVSDQVRRALARRLVLPRGDWHLWIYCCHWRVLAEDREIACSKRRACSSTPIGERRRDSTLLRWYWRARARPTLAQGR